jgi:hypothetical protein
VNGAGTSLASGCAMHFALPSSFGLLLLLSSLAACGGVASTALPDGGCVAAPVAGGSCTPGVPACGTGSSCSTTDWTCDPSTKTWDAVEDNIACLADAGRGPEDAGGSDAGSTPCGTSSCSGGEVCVETTSGGGACLAPADGGACPGTGTGPCCNSYTSYVCSPRPAGCGADVSCACAKALCGDGGVGVGGCQSGTGSVLQCAGEEFP